MIIEKFNIKDFKKLKPLLNDYKKSIHEAPLTETQFAELKKAIETEKISFYTAVNEGEIIAMCSVALTFSTYNCQPMGIFEDFYINPLHRGKGLASKLTAFVFSQMEALGVNSVWVGSADMDVNMYKHLGFTVPLGNLLAWSRD